MTKLFVNENLTHCRKKLFWSTKRAAKANNYKFFLTASGKILVKKDDNGPVIKNLANNVESSLTAFFFIATVLLRQTMIKLSKHLL